MADDLLDFLPLFPDDTEPAILARMSADANEGLDPVVDVDEWVDVREGSHWFVCVMPGVREFARLYDLAGTEVVAAGMPVWAWGDYLDDHAEVQDIVRLPATSATGDVLFTGTVGTLIPAGSVVGVEPATPDDIAPEFEVTTGGTIDADGVLLPVRALDAGVAGNVGATAVVVPPTGVAGVTVSNPEATAGGTEAESDEALRERVLSIFAGERVGNVLYYKARVGAFAGVGRVTVIPLWDGPGTVKVIVTTADGDPVASDVVDAIQADLDPVPGMGEGGAPVSAEVTVETATALPITVAGPVEFEDGYSMDGDAGTIALRGLMTAAVREYVERVESGGEVVPRQVLGRIVTIDGVHDAGPITLNGAGAVIPVSADPAQAPQLVVDANGLIAGLVAGAVA